MEGKTIIIDVNAPALNKMLCDTLARLGEALNIDLCINAAGLNQAHSKDEKLASLVICSEVIDQKRLAALPISDALTQYFYIGEAKAAYSQKFDYILNQPFKLGALMDRVAAVLQNRAIGGVARRLPIQDWYLIIPDNKLMASHSSVGALDIQLTDTESVLLKALYAAPDNQLCRADLLDNVWGYQSDLDTHTLETHIYRLRQKIEADPATPRILLTIDDGYKLCL